MRRPEAFPGSLSGLRRAGVTFSEERKLRDELMAVAALAARYQMALEAAAVCGYTSDVEAIVKRALSASS
jgi:hypothetical protein